jgi:hypothetical protein
MEEDSKFEISQGYDTTIVIDWCLVIYVYDLQVLFTFC